jgi:hypothetical protein
MQKRIVGQTRESIEAESGPWLDLEAHAQVQLTSEDPAYPIETAFRPERGAGWKAAQPGPQTITLQFSVPQTIQQIQLRFEADSPRTQEFVVSWSNNGVNYREIVRQQFNFAPDGATVEEENYFPRFSGAMGLRLTIIPDISGRPALASLRAFRVR